METGYGCTVYTAQVHLATWKLDMAVWRTHHSFTWLHGNWILLYGAHITVSLSYMETGYGCMVHTSQFHLATWKLDMAVSSGVGGRLSSNRQMVQLPDRPVEVKEKHFLMLKSEAFTADNMYLYIVPYTTLTTHDSSL
jgi:hypothetical protein